MISELKNENRSGIQSFEAIEAVFTSHGTVLFVDEASGELRHGMPQNCPANVRLFSQGEEWQLRFVNSRSEKEIECLPAYSAIIDSPRIISDARANRAGTAFVRIDTFSHWSGEKFGLKAADQFLRALPGGEVKLDAFHLREWEQFKLKREASEINGTIISHRVDGQLISFFVANRADWIQFNQCRGDFWEREGLNLIRENCIPERVFIDIGANIGNHAVFVSKFCNVSRVIVFEPNPTAIKILKINLRLNACANVDESYLGFALGSKQKRVRAVVPVLNNLGMSQVLDDSEGRITCVPGDEFLLSEPVGFIKIDVEGMDFDVLSGLNSTIERWRPNIFIEVKTDNIPRMEAWCNKMNYCVKTMVPEDNFLLVPMERV